MERYYTLNRYFKEIFNCRVHKITIDAGFTCPNRDGVKGTGGCIYCNPAGSGTGAYGQNLSVSEQVKSGINYLSGRFKAKKFLAYFQAYSNTYGSVEKLKELYDQALIDERVTGLSIGTRPDCLEEEKLDLLENYKKKGYMIWLELGLQSIHNKTLDFINRCHSYEDFLISFRRAKERNFPVCVHIIMGLPGETFQDMMETIEKLAELNIDGIKFHNLYIIKGSIMEKLYNEGKYVPLKREEYVNIICEALSRLPKKVVIQRLTGDPGKEELIAPEWSADKRKTTNLINENLIEKNLWQGKNCDK